MLGRGRPLFERGSILTTVAREIKQNLLSTLLAADEL